MQWRHGGLMVSALDSGSGGLNTNGYQQMCWGNPAMD